jgi:hypothetical protein
MTVLDEPIPLVARCSQCGASQKAKKAKTTVSGIKLPVGWKSFAGKAWCKSCVK